MNLRKRVVAFGAWRESECLMDINMKVEHAETSQHAETAAKNQDMLSHLLKTELQNGKMLITLLYFT